MDKRPIGVFDSGLGGVSTLRQALHMLPRENFLYYGDNANAPYGSRSAAEITALSGGALRFFKEKGVKAVLLACNTSTAVALETLRRESPLPIAGIEPPIRAAAASPGTGRILAMATEATTRMTRERALRENPPGIGRVAFIPCDAEFVRRVEGGMSGPEDYGDLFSAALSPYKGMRVDGIVLGCTHYLFFQRQLCRYAGANFTGTPRFYDGGQASVREMRRLLAERGLENTEGNGEIAYYTSGSMDLYRPRFEALLRQPMQIAGIEL